MVVELFSRFAICKKQFSNDHTARSIFTQRFEVRVTKSAKFQPVKDHQSKNS